MSEKANLFNGSAFRSGKLRIEHITKLVESYQQTHGLPVDGMCGPDTIAHLTREPPPEAPTIAVNGSLTVDDRGWLVGVTRLPMHASWNNGPMRDGPRAIVAHYTATDPGTGAAMAKRRQSPHGPDDRFASWHLTIETDGSVIQMAPLNARCWHAGGEGSKPIPGIGSANANAIGIELVGYGKAFTDRQIEAACKVWRAIVNQYRIDQRFAMVQHSALSPHDRSDPGPVWMGTHAPTVLNYAYSAGK